jgi:arylsulfatase A-like enzyme
MHWNTPITRRDALKRTASSLTLLGLGAKTHAAGESGRKMNVVFFMTDQERAIQHFPAGWEQENLPGLTRLKRNGLSFTNAFTDACMCSPARSTLMSGYFPAQHGVKYTLEEDMPARLYPQVELPLNFRNIATVMTAAGYNVVYKGKWHCSKPSGKHWVRVNLDRYGFNRWDPQDAGANQDADQAGGGNANNDGRFMYDNGQWEAGREGAIPFLTSVAAKQQPFFLTISLVNPHDVLFYPKSYLQAGYDDSWLAGDIDIPLTHDELLFTKPSVQEEFRILSQGLGVLDTPEKQRNYVNFYGNLMKSSDNYLVEVLDTLQNEGLLDNTLVIRTADHGEMGLTHGGQRQKNFNFYEESIRVPLVYSNPNLYPAPRNTEALVSHVDFLPTMASLFNAPASARAPWQGVDYSRLIVDPSAPPVQDYIVFTYDDYQSGQKNGPYPTPPNHIASIREARYKFAEYYDVNGKAESQYEMYDLQEDPLERQNIAYRLADRSPEYKLQYERLRLKLQTVKAQRLQPLS